MLMYPSATMATVASTGEKPKVVLAYSGGLDTSVILVWLIEKVWTSYQVPECADNRKNAGLHTKQQVSC